MRPGLYLALGLTIVPIQSTVLQVVSLGGVRPDIGLVAVCLVGLMEEELVGVMMGIAIGFTQDLLSASVPGLNLVTKAGLGLLAGLIGRQVAHMTPSITASAMFGLSCLSSVVLIIFSNIDTWLDLWHAVLWTMIPQAGFDTLVGGGLYWLVVERMYGARLWPASGSRGGWG